MRQRQKQNILELQDARLQKCGMRGYKIAKFYFPFRNAQSDKLQDVGIQNRVILFFPFRIS